METRLGVHIRIAHFNSAGGIGMLSIDWFAVVLFGKYKGTWEEVIQKVIDNGDKITGTMIHRVTPELDTGPPITFCEVNIEGCDFDEVRRRQKKQETALLVETLVGLCNRTIKIDDAPINLTKQVKEFLEKNS